MDSLFELVGKVTVAERLKARPEILDRHREVVEHSFGSIKIPTPLASRVSSGPTPASFRTVCKIYLGPLQWNPPRVVTIVAAVIALLPLEDIKKCDAYRTTPCY
jgi:hypothetical protein